MQGDIKINSSSAQINNTEVSAKTDIKKYDVYTTVLRANGKVKNKKLSGKLGIAQVIEQSTKEGIEVLYGTLDNPISLHDERFRTGESKMYFICGCITDFQEDSETMIAIDAKNNEEAVYKLYVQPMNAINDASYLITLDASDYLNVMSIGEYPSLFYDIYYTDEENEETGMWLGWLSTTYGSFTKSLLGSEQNPIDLSELDNSYIYKVTGYLKETPPILENYGYVRNNKLRGYLYVFNQENSYYPSIYIIGNKIFAKDGGDSFENMKEFIPLPMVSSEDDGKVLVVENGEWVVKKIN